LYRLGASVLEALAAGRIEPLARYFEFWIMRLQGVYPSFTTCHGCGCALNAEGGGAWLAPGSHVFTCAACAPAGNGNLAPSLSPEALGFLSTVRRLPPLAVGALMLTPPVAAELERVHHMLMGRHLERELKSTRVLRELRRVTATHPERQADSKR
jgi:recombinational DNA repair protein (RecF pathway)